MKKNRVITKKVLGLLSNSELKLAFELIVSEYSEKMYWHIRYIVSSHDDANDVLQNVFIKVWKNLSNFKGDAKVYTWLYRIATNESLTFIAKRKRRIQMHSENSEVKVVTQVEVSMGCSEIEKRLEEAISYLPDKQKIVFQLKYFEALKYDEIAEITDTSVGALKASYHIAVKKIEKYLKSN